MHSSALALTAASLLIPLASSGCYKKGPSAVNKQLAIDNLDTICGNMQGNFRSGLERTGCVTDDVFVVAWSFYIKCIDTADQTLTLDQCKFGLKRELDGCSTGGDRKDGSWEYKVDANNGVCVDTRYINSHPPPQKREDEFEKKEANIASDIPEPPRPQMKKALRYAA